MTSDRAIVKDTGDDIHWTCKAEEEDVEAEEAEEIKKKLIKVIKFIRNLLNVVLY